jgi:hypothetical protein
VDATIYGALALLGKPRRERFMFKIEGQRLLTALMFAGVTAGVVIGGTTALQSQERNPMSQQAPPDDNKITKESEGVYLYRIKVVQRDLDAVNYLHRSASTKIAFKGTAPGEGRGQGGERAGRHHD